MVAAEPQDGTRSTRVLVTGAGGPAAIGFMRLSQRPDVELWAADMDPVATGLYLVPRTRRVVVPAGAHPGFVEALLDVCHLHRIEVLVPTVDAELLPLARARHRFEAAGTRVLVQDAEVLERCLDKHALARTCTGVVPVPHTELLEEGTEVSLPAVLKPRSGSGSRGVHVLPAGAAVPSLPRDGSHVVQELLPGEELSVDVLVRADGHVVAAVPRTRDRVDSGVAVAGRVVADPAARSMARRTAEHLGIRGVANVQLRRRADGSLALLEVNPRLPGTLVLTAAAGANLAALLLAEALGEDVPAWVPVRPVAVVRHLTEVVVPLEEYLEGAEAVSA